MSQYAIFTALAQASEGSPGGMGSTFLILILMFAGMYFLVIAPQRKKQKQHQKRIEALKAGDRIVTNGGLYATITSVKSDRLVIKLADNTKAELAKNFVATVLQPDSDTKDLKPEPQADQAK